MSALASQADLEARLGRALTAAEEARIDALLDDASALVRAYTGQAFSLTEDEEITLPAISGKITLPQRPVIDITHVIAVGGSDALPDFAVVDWMFDGIETIRVGSGGFVINLPEAWWDDEDGYPGTYRVTYSHGYATVPGDVLSVVCGMALRTLTSPTTAGGVVSETIGSYSYRLDSASGGLGVVMSAEDRKVLDRYRRTATTTRVGR
ncbi:hypothetical protein ACGFNU_21310 [Spirillospora sp. NPDC048911]|uniref:hypothetical protein n=1 Tax=Spirillospora sp. NPDC048911 TaxID=3364527 RepID=UPI00372312CA